MTYIIRVWMPDRPGALGALASRIGAVGGDLTGIDILERGAGRAIDELVVELPDDSQSLVDLLVAEIHQVDGVDVEDIRPARVSTLHDPASTPSRPQRCWSVHPPRNRPSRSCARTPSARSVRHEAVVDLEAGEVVVGDGDVPAGWIVAFVANGQSSARVADGDHGPADVAWAPLPSAGLALVLGRNGTAFRARERRQAAALARIVDTRFRELKAMRSRLAHPSSTR